MNGQNYQDTSSPYSADLLAPHDVGIQKILEFGTETTLDSGDAFTGSLGFSTVNSVNARVGMLEVQQLNSGVTKENGVAGSTFLLPEWSSYPPSPFFGSAPDDPRVICIYAHLLKREANVQDPEEDTALLMLAGEDFVGDVSIIQSTGIGLIGDAPEDGAEGGLTIKQWSNGTGVEATSEDTNVLWGSNLYIRLIAIGDDTKETDVGIDVSRDGLTWTHIVDTQVLANGEAMRRIGLGYTGGTGVAWLDWVRVYAYPVAGDVDGLLQPLAPLTGARRY